MSFDHIIANAKRLIENGANIKSAKLPNTFDVGTINHHMLNGRMIIYHNFVMNGKSYGVTLYDSHGHSDHDIVYYE